MVLQRKSSSMWELATRKCEIEFRYYTDMGAGDFSLLPFSSVLWKPFKLDQRSLWTFNTHVLILLRKFQRKRAKLRRRKNHLEGLRLALTFSNKRPFGICIKLSEIKLMLIGGAASGFIIASDYKQRTMIKARATAAWPKSSLNMRKYSNSSLACRLINSNHLPDLSSTKEILIISLSLSSPAIKRRRSKTQ